MTVTEPTLPGFDCLSRLGDPQTSKDAGETVDVNARERECIDALRWLVVASSAYEIQRCLSNHGIEREKSCISRRLTSLTRKRIVTEQGTKPGPYGRMVTTYRLAKP